MYVCGACGATMQFVIEGAKEPTPSEWAEAMAGTLRQALAKLPANTNSEAIARIEGVIHLLETKQF